MEHQLVWRNNMKSKEQILDLLEELGNCATDYDNYEYGLPLHTKEQVEKMIEIVENWLDEKEIKEYL